ncbi:response regulator transcription factor [Acaryochloris marina]|uniref:Response regulator n=1 Tax=Acaryochloris marina (strain MBIC 11017) TaxID=329726 RepID=B0C8Q4_ACAM1|nr:response regulator [Acaryochloris marina]ABW31316.1 response regulator [Acaryochloris marina MBIC11017]BDM79993.1 hypothetical protein AM10699_28610 [Acaryochloris marina MBIC10699]
MKRVLLVEDEERIARFVEKGLLKHGYQSTLVTDGQQALDQANLEAFDVVLLDLGLPIISGWTVLQTLRQRGFTVPIIVITAFVDQDELALASGATDFISKPFQFSELIETIQRHLADS